LPSSRWKSLVRSRAGPYDALMAGSGGAAVNSGIDFQQRVGALAMLSMATDVEVRWLWRDARGELVTEVRFETSDAIDDLVVITDGPRLLVQAKRSLSFSVVETSEFASAIGQFVSQFAREPTANDVYVLATSSTASRTITVDLRKLTEAARLNELGLTKNPLTTSEMELLEKIYELIEGQFAKRTERSMSLDERNTFFARIHVALLDLERGAGLERAVLTVIATKSTVDPEAVWGSLIALALAFAKERLSIDRPALMERVGHLFVRASDRPSVGEVADAAGVVLENPLSSGREVVLVEYDEESVLLIELIRFDDQGVRRARFVDGEIDTPSGRWRVLRRTSTLAGMERMVLADPSSIEGRKVVLIPINSEEDFESSPWARAHASQCEQLMRERGSVLVCIQCGRPISEGSPCVVEVDEEGLPHDVGLVHTACLRPMHRIIGRVSIEAFSALSLPPDFDHSAWIESRPTGQGAFDSMSPALRGQIVMLAWKPSRLPSSVGSWGVSYELEDGSLRYVHERGRVLRLTKPQAREHATDMNAAIANANEANDPLCVSAATGAYGTYSSFLRSEPGAAMLKVVSAEPRELTRATLTANDKVENFYAPLLCIVDAVAGKPFTLAGMRVLLTDPLRLGESVENWERGGVTVPALQTTVLRSDEQFDSFILSSQRAGEGVVVDPVLGPSGQPLAGAVVTDLEAMAREAAEQ
jgi:hypothetical protein